MSQTLYKIVSSESPAVTHVEPTDTFDSNHANSTLSSLLDASDDSIKMGFSSNLEEIVKDPPFEIYRDEHLSFALAPPQAPQIAESTANSSTERTVIVNSERFYLQSSIKSHSIWQSMEFWAECFYHTIRCHKCFKLVLCFE
jgi:hypothetical protein